ncbi:MAG: hypothetical protein WCE90_10980 [Candidatus Zixiibacteriota bacterium]
MREGIVLAILLVLVLLPPTASLALADDPGYPDTCRVGRLDVVAPGQHVVVEVSAFNDEALGGLAVPLGFGYAPLEVACDSVSFAGTRIMGAEYMGVCIDTANYGLVFYAIYLSSNLPPGDGPIAKLYFTTGPGWDSTSCVHIDTTFFPPTTSLEFSPRASGQALHPRFQKGCLASGLPPSPTLISPSTQSHMCSPDTFGLVWSKVGEATSYTLQYAQDPSFTTGVVTKSGLADTSYWVSLSRGTYFWHVKSTNQCSKESPYQEMPFCNGQAQNRLFDGSRLERFTSFDLT